MSMTLEEYKKLLTYHDWFYEMSDDHKVWKAGRLAQAKIIAGSRESENHMKLYMENKP